MKNIVYLQTLKVNLQFKLMKYCVPNILFGCIDLSIVVGLFEMLGWASSYYIGPECFG